MVFSENRVLVQDKRDDDYSGITFPGGHVERGESFTDAVIREVWEETGLKITEPKLCGIKDWMKDEETRYIVLLYKTAPVYNFINDRLVDESAVLRSLS